MLYRLILGYLIAILIALLVVNLAACGGGDPEATCVAPPYSMECPPAVVDYPTAPCPSQYDPTQRCQVHPPTTQPVHCDEQDCH